MAANVIPVANTYQEGSIWDLTAPSTQTWVAQRNLTFNHELFMWTQSQKNGPWRGIGAVVRQPAAPNHMHDVLLALNLNQYVTSLFSGYGIQRIW